MLAMHPAFHRMIVHRSEELGDEKYLSELRTHRKVYKAFPSMAQMGFSWIQFTLDNRLCDEQYLERVEVDQSRCTAAGNKFTSRCYRLDFSAALRMRSLDLRLIGNPQLHIYGHWLNLIFQEVLSG